MSLAEPDSPDDFRADAILVSVVISLSKFNIDDVCLVTYYPSAIIVSAQGTRITNRHAIAMLFVRLSVRLSIHPSV